jgi:hypothetical protein
MKHFVLYHEQDDLLCFSKPWYKTIQNLGDLVSIDLSNLFLSLPLSLTY